MDEKKTITIGFPLDKWADFEYTLARSQQFKTNQNRSALVIAARALWQARTVKEV